MKRVRIILVTILTTALILSNFTGNFLVRKADAATKSVDIILDEKVGDIVGVPGETVHVSIPVRAAGSTVYNPRISVNSTEMPFIVENITYKVGNYDPNNEPTYIPDFSIL